MIIESSAPTRVDLAGGTIDIPPLFLFHEGAATVNFAIDLMARCRIETRDDDRIVLESIDRGLKFESSLEHFAELKNEPRLVLKLGKMLERRFELKSPVDRFENDAVVVPRFDPASGHQIDGKIYGSCSLVKEKERRNINCAAGKVDPCRG